MIPVILMGIETLGPARFSFVNSWWPRQPRRFRQLAIAVPVASSSGKALILAF
jgi:hypothetical protein